MQNSTQFHSPFYPEMPIQFDPQTLLADPSYITQAAQILYQRISPLYSVDEDQWLKALLPLAKPKSMSTVIVMPPTLMAQGDTDPAYSDERTAISAQTKALVEQVRHNDDAVKMVDSLLLEYSLDTHEGVLLMSLAEALIRVPDNATADALIKDKMSVADWEKHLKDDNGFVVNASTWGLMMTGRVVKLDSKTTARGVLDRLTKKMGEPVIRSAMQQAMRIMGHQFVLGETIADAQRHSQAYRKKGYTYSFDMLGEAAISYKDAEKYFKAYLNAIRSAADIEVKYGMPKPSVSIKLSALHPRYEATQGEQVLGLLRQRCILLIEAARDVDVDISIDAEEADRLEISLKLFESLYRDIMTQGWDGLGIVVQAYSKRAIAVLAWLASLAHEVGDRIPVRLVKGAYWDYEIKLAQQKGFTGYPVWTRKEGTDVAYLACARFLLTEQVRGLIWPQFATHNAHTLASVMTMSHHKDYEFQRLHGMGDALYDHILKTYELPVRIYAPVGAHKDLLPYLVRRLLENGANSSFIHQLLDKSHPVAELTVHPYDKLMKQPTLHNDRIVRPLEIYTSRQASYGPNINVASQWQPFKQAVDCQLKKTWSAVSIINSQAVFNSTTIRTADHAVVRVKSPDLNLEDIETNNGVNKGNDEVKETTDAFTVDTVYAPWDHDVEVGQVQYANAEDAKQAIHAAKAGQALWQSKPVGDRAAILRRIADAYEANYTELIALCQKEAGKTVQDSIDEVREAVDFCRYYADEAERLADQVTEFTDAYGSNIRQKRVARGTIVCISPWNFPLAIYTGQIVAALVVGNTVVAKPAEQSSLIACFAAKLMYASGVPEYALQFVVGAGKVGAALTGSAHVDGVIFTGSTDTAQRINQSLFAKQIPNESDKPIASEGQPTLPILIAETGGLNAMIVDSTALPEQVVKDTVLSAFGSAGQRCSACRILCVQQDVADDIIELLKGMMAELVVGNPIHVSCDVGPVIDKDAQKDLRAHIERMRQSPQVHIIAQTPISAASADKLSNTTFVLPTAIAVDSIETIEGEHFGPILHVLKYKAEALDDLIDAINATGYGLTLGIHSRIETKTDHIERRMKVGNTYINRNQIGAVVGEQPFGGCGLSGTGPKAGGPRYLTRLTKWQRV